MGRPDLRENGYPSSTEGTDGAVRLPTNYEEVFASSNSFLRAIAADIGDGITNLGIAKDSYTEIICLLDGANPNIKGTIDIDGDINNIIQNVESTYTDVSSDVISYQGLTDALITVIARIEENLEGKGTYTHEDIEKLLAGDYTTWVEMFGENAGDGIKYFGKITKETVKSLIKSNIHDIWLASLASYGLSITIDAYNATAKASVKEFFKGFVKDSLSAGQDVISQVSQKRFEQLVFDKFSGTIIRRWNENHYGEEFVRDKAIKEFLEELPPKSRVSTINDILTGASGELIKLGLSYGVTLAFDTDFFQNWGEGVGETMAVAGAKTLVSWAGGKIGAAIGSAIGGPVGTCVGFVTGEAVSVVGNTMVDYIVKELNFDSDDIPVRYRQIPYNEALETAKDDIVHLYPDSNTDWFGRLNQYEVRAEMESNDVPDVVLDYVTANNNQSTETLKRDDGSLTPEALALNLYLNNSDHVTRAKFRDNSSVTKEEIEGYIDNMPFPEGYYSDEEVETFRETVEEIISWEMNCDNDKINDVYTMCGDTIHGAQHWYF